MPNTWDPNNQSTGGAAASFSNGNLTWTTAANNPNQTGVKGTGPGTPGGTGGKYYYEAKCDVASTIAPFQGVGVILDVKPFTAAGATIAAVCTNGFWFANGTNNGGTGFFTYTNNDIIGTAYDPVNQQIWFRKNGGLWNNSGAANPATNVGGISTANLIGTVLPYSDCGSTSGANGQWTGNFGATAYNAAAPAGFGNWPTPVGNFGMFFGV